jgi:trimethylamine--corrinoid protein Co-methyltransferase
MMESDALLVLDDELCGAALRTAQGIEVSEDTLALDLISRIGPGGHYLAETHTVEHFRKEHFIPRLLVRDPYDAWKDSGEKSALELAKARARKILAEHQPRQLDPAVSDELEKYRQMIAERPIEEFYAYEDEERQDFGAL